MLGPKLSERGAGVALAAMVRCRNPLCDYEAYNVDLAVGAGKELLSVEHREYCCGKCAGRVGNKRWLGDGRGHGAAHCQFTRSDGVPTVGFCRPLLLGPAGPTGPPQDAGTSSLQSLPRPTLQQRPLPEHPVVPTHRA